MRETFEVELGSARRDASRRLAEHNRHAKKEKEKWREHVSCVEQDNADASRHAQLLEEKLIVSTRKLCLARDKIFDLESELQTMRTRPPQVVERADPGAVAEAVRLRDRASGMAEEARRAQKAAAESREAVGRGLAINQGLQRDTDNARHRLLTVQGSFAESVEENAGLKRELEAERIKAAAGSRRLADAVERQDAALAEVRLDSGQLRDQRDSLAQDCAVMSIKLHQLKRKEAAGRILHVLSRAQHASLARALRAWVVGATNDIHSKKRARRQEEHSSEIKSLETDLLGAEIRCRDERRRNEALRDSRERVAESAVMATRRRGGVATAAQDRGSPALQWCFWGWARVARGGNIAMASRARRVGIVKELAHAKERAHVAETELVQHRAAAEKLNTEVAEVKEDLEVTRAALDAIRCSVSAAKDRTIRLGLGRVAAILGRDRRNKVALAFTRWTDATSTFARSPENYPSPGPLSARRVSSTRAMQPKTETGEARRRRSSPIVPPRWDSSRVPTGSNDDDSALPAVAQMRRVSPAFNGRNDDVSSPPAVSEMRGIIAPNVHEERSVETSDARQFDVKVPPPAPSIEEVDSIDEQEANVHVGTQTRASSRRSSSRSGLCAAPSLGDIAAEWTKEETVNMEKDATQILKRGISVGSRSCEHPPLSTKASGTSNGAGNDAFCSSSSSSSSINSTRSSVCPSDELDLPRLMLHLRAAVGEELYAVGERLLRCVEADHREIHGRPYCPVSLTGAERDQFRACFEDAVQGPLRHAVVAFLQTQESCRAMAVERGREQGQARRVMNGGGGRKEGGRRSGGDSVSEFNGASAVSRGMKNARLVAGHNHRERNSDISSLVTGPLSTPAEKAWAARVLRDRLVGLLEDADEVWGTRRQPWRTLRAGIAARGPRSRTAATSKRGGANPMRKEADRSPSSRRMCSLDSGAGPRKLWEAVVGPRFIEAGWKIDAKALERSLWDLAILVRNQDRGQKVALRRCERLRRVLDLRIYEVLLLHVRTRLLWDGIKDGCGTVVGGTNGTDATVWTELEDRASK
ncbi:unnamed protein product [Laminaria digitata]